MKISEVIELLSKCDPDEEFAVKVWENEVDLNVPINIKCPVCDDGTIEVEVMEDRSFGFQSNGDYREPSYEVVSVTCPKCGGSEVIQDEDFVEADYCLCENDEVWLWKR